MGFVNEKLANGECQVIDYKFDIFLECTDGGGPEGDPEKFNLVFEGGSVNYWSN
ncbi:hypothetical protein [Nitrosomonas sp.]|uniref:hypothetical protein n=1 Tax=Nitrosomonas sp. TaxID=42353 RepID=UPI0025EB4DB1|nr:hypothetical protein [Nitrosomonas sp.]